MMKIFKRRPVSAVSTIAGLILTGVGFYLWKTSDINTKLFQLSNDLIGAGIFVVLVSLLVMFMKR